MDSRFCTYKRVGYLKASISKILGIDFTGIVYASPGVLKHIEKRHNKQIDTRSKDSILGWMKEIIEKPDYIGIYKNKKGQEAVELVKELYIDLLLVIEIDEENGYIYVSTMYPISKRKIKNKLYSGKLISINEYIKDDVESCIV